jgi:hypothetical protein
LSLVACGVGAIGLPYTFALTTVSWVMFLISSLLHGAALLFSIREYNKSSTETTGPQAEDVGAAAQL